MADGKSREFTAGIGIPGMQGNMLVFNWSSPFKELTDEQWERYKAFFLLHFSERLEFLQAEALEYALNTPIPTEEQFGPAPDQTDKPTRSSSEPPGDGPFRQPSG